MEEENPQIAKKSKVQYVTKDCIETLIWNAYKQAKFSHPKEERINVTSILKRMTGLLMDTVNRKIEKTINPQWQSGEMIVQGHKTFNPADFKVVPRDLPTTSEPKGGWEVMDHEMTLTQWMDRKRNSERILGERRAEVSIMEADVRLCEQNIRKLSGYDKIAKQPTTQSEG